MILRPAKQPMTERHVMRMNQSQHRDGGDHEIHSMQGGDGDMEDGDTQTFTDV